MAAGNISRRMAEIRELQASDGMLLKEVRLRALRDAPHAFGGMRTYEEETAFPDSQWHQLAAELGGEVPLWRDRCAAFVAFQGDEACGIASTYLCSRVPGRAFFSAAWVDSRFRRQGNGRALVRKAIDWAQARNADHLRLWVDDANPDADAFYLALGFVPTGEQSISPGLQRSD